MINEKELQFILQEGEGLKIEFKESFDSKSFAKELVAFANASGGQIFIGINDKSEVIGFSPNNTLKSQIQDVARNCEPPIKISLETFIFQKIGILIVNVREGMNKPYLCSSGFYLRQGANAQKLTRDEIIQSIIGLGKVRFD